MDNRDRNVLADIVNEFDHQFIDEAACIDWFLKRYYTSGPHCPSCGYIIEGRAAERNFRALKRFECPGCARRIRSTFGTILGTTNLSVQQFILLVFLVGIGADNHLITEKVGASVNFVNAWRRKLKSNTEVGN